MQVAEVRALEAREEAEAAQRILQQKVAACTTFKTKMVRLLGLLTPDDLYI